MSASNALPKAFAGTDAEKCYQCGKCTAGCPVAERTGFVPNRVVRLVQRGMVDQAMANQGVWHCVSCQTCTARCPQSVDCAGIMDVLRQMAFERGKTPASQMRVLVFQKAFLDNIRRYGRVNEVELIGVFKTLAFTKDFNVPLLMRDSLLAPKLMQRGKFHLTGEKVGDRGIVQRIFERCGVGEQHEGTHA